MGKQISFDLTTATTGNKTDQQEVHDPIARGSYDRLKFVKLLENL